MIESGETWKARTRRELVIEVWEHLDCESVGAPELQQISIALLHRFGEGALMSPAALARIVAEEGAVLRHHEVLELDTRFRGDDPYAAMFRQIIRFSSFQQAAGSIRRLENLRRQFLRTNDKTGLRRVLEAGIRGKTRAQIIARNKSVSENKRAEKAEIAEWFKVWLQQPELFEDWLQLRLHSQEFQRRFAPIQSCKPGSELVGEGDPEGRPH